MWRSSATKRGTENADRRWRHGRFHRLGARGDRATTAPRARSGPVERVATTGGRGAPVANTAGTSDRGWRRGADRGARDHLLAHRVRQDVRPRSLSTGGERVRDGDG